MNPYQMLLQSIQEQQPAKVPVGLDAFNNVDVAENIGHDKLKKKPYNPYSLVAVPAENAPARVPTGLDAFRED